MPPKDAAPRGAPGAGDGGRDRLIALPDRVLARILSRLRAWEAVRACCALSTRWRGLWRAVRRLDIRQPCCDPAPARARARAAAGDDDDGPRRAAEEAALGAFVNNLLLLRPMLAPLDSLRLCWRHDGWANTWIAHAVRRGAEEVELSGRHHAERPSPAYTSFIVREGAAVRARLRVLKLVHLKLGGTILRQLCSRCTCLEELELRDCLVSRKAEIRTTLLKRLAMIKCHLPRGLLVYAPNLASLRCGGTVGCVPWIDSLGLLGRDNIMQRAPHRYPECSDLGSCNLRTLKLSRVKLDDATLTQLCSRCASLEHLELKDCLLDGSEIRSTSLRCLAMISCEFVVETRVHVPNLVSLCCTRPCGYVPQIQHMECLVKATIVFDDSCFLIDRQWTQEEVDNDESDHDAHFFAHPWAEESYESDRDDNSDDESDHGDNSDDESDHDDNSDDEPDHDGHDFAHPAAEDSYESDHGDNSDSESNRDDNRDDESDHGGHFFARPGPEDSYESDHGSNSDAESNCDDHRDDESNRGDNSDDESDHNDNRDDEFDHDNSSAHAVAKDSDNTDGNTNPDSSGPGDEDNDHTVAYSQIAEECKDDCGGMFGGDGLLRSLSNVRTMDLLAHSGEVLLTRESKSCTDFKNLKTLSLGEWCITPDLDVLTAILQRSRSLEKLSVHLDMANKGRVGFKPRKDLFTCTNLKIVKITCCKHDKMVHILANLFRLNGIPDEDISVHWTACTCNVEEGTDSQVKRKAQSEVGKREVKQMKTGN